MAETINTQAKMGINKNIEIQSKQAKEGEFKNG